MGTHARHTVRICCRTSPISFHRNAPHPPYASCGSMHARRAYFCPLRLLNNFAWGGEMSDNPGSTPALWLRILQFPLTRLLVLGGIVFFLMAVNGGFMATHAGKPFQAIAITIGMATVTLAIYAGYARFIEQRPVSELSLRGAGRELSIGLLVGASLYVSCVLILMALGMYRIEGLNPGPSSFLLWRWR